ncbi:MAG: hypothetical protein AAGD01_10930 [Acidobacteriota bacterium]
MNEFVVCLRKHYIPNLPVLNDPIDPKSRVGLLYQLPVTFDSRSDYVYFGRVDGSWEAVFDLSFNAITVYLKDQELGDERRSDE